MAKKEKGIKGNSMLFYSVSEKATKLNKEYYEVYERILNFLMKNEKDDNKLNFLLDRVIDDLLESEEKGLVAKARVGNDYKAYIKKIEKTINFKEETRKQRNIDYEKYTISSIWLVLMMFISLLFIRNWIIEDYIISFAIDGIVGAVAIYFGLANFFAKYRVSKRYKFPNTFIYFDVVVFVLCLAVKFMTPAEYGNFDITFLFLVCSYLLPKKRIRKLFEAAA